MNTVILYGAVARDPNVRITQGGKTVASFTVVTTRVFQDKQFKDYVSCIAWGNAAQIVGNSVKAGTTVLARGRVGTRSYETANGEKKWVTEVNVDSVEVVGAAAPQQQQPYNAGFSQPASGGFGQFGNAEEEIPF